MSETDYLIFDCPHCDQLVFIYKEEIACKIFRHAQFTDEYLEKEWINSENRMLPHFKDVPDVIKESMRIFGSHTSEELCNKHREEGNIAGCARPFEIIQSGTGEWIIQKCGYNL